MTTQTIDKRKVRLQKDLCNKEDGLCINYAGTYYYMEDGDMYWKLREILSERLKGLVYTNSFFIFL